MLPELACLLSFLAPCPSLPAPLAHPARLAPQVQPVLLTRAWTSSIGALREAPLLGAREVGGLLLVEDGKHGITALHPDTGEVAWFVQLPGPLTHWPSADETLVLSSGTSQVVVDARTGTRLETRRDASIAATAPASDGRLVFVPSLLGDQLVVYDIETGLRAWAMGMEHAFASQAVLVGAATRRTVLVVTEDGMLRAVPASVAVPRTERWVLPVGRPVGRPVLAGDTLYVASAERALWAVTPSTGEVRWKHLPGEPLTSPPVLVGDRLVTATATRLLALDPADGHVAWQVEGSYTPLGEVAGRLLVRERETSCQLREPADGSLALGGLPGDLLPAGPVAVSLHDGRVEAWGRP